MIIDIIPKNAVLKFMLYNKNKPADPRIIHIKIAWLRVILPAGIGLFKVRDINASLFRSIIWLKPLDDPTIRNPPAIKRKILSIENTSKAKRYDAIDETTTLKDSLYLIRISISVNKDVCFKFNWLEIRLFTRK